MATMYIVEFSELAKGAKKEEIPVPSYKGAEVQQVVTVSGATQSAAFAPETSYVRILCDFEVHLEFGDNPTAATATSATQLQADETHHFGVVGGSKVSAIAAV